MKTAIFDLGNVIAFFDHNKMVAQLSLCTGLTTQGVQQFLDISQLPHRYECGQITSEELYQEFLTASPKHFSRDTLYYAAADIFTPNTQIFPLIEQLKSKNIRLVLLSNTSEAHYHFLSPRLPILSLFDAQILSYQIKAAKPMPAIYHAAIHEARCKSTECFYTDDIPLFIDAAKTHGIDAVLYTDVPSLRKELSNRLVN